MGGQYEKFQASHHFMLEELEQRLSGILQRYEALHEPVQIRRENLEDSLLLHQFNREVADETIWLEEKLPQRKFLLPLPRILELRWPRFKISSRSTISSNLRSSPTTKWSPSWSPRRSRWSVRRTLLPTTSR